MTAHRPDENTTPSPPVSTPSKSANDWAMHAFIDLKVTMASVEANMKTLTEKVGELKDEQTQVKSKLSTVEKQIYAAAAVVTVVIALGGYVGNKAIDFGMDMAKRTVYAQPAAPVIPPRSAPLNTTPSQPGG